MWIVLTSVSLVVMLWLARAKRQASAALKSRALEADAFSDHSLLVAVALDAGWHRLERPLRLVLGGPGGRACAVFFIAKEG